MPTTKVNDIEMYYETHGRGEALLLIMGLGTNATAWELQIPAFSREYKVIAFDNRDSGRSGQATAPYTISQMADDAAALLDTLSTPWAHVYGVSMGGMIAQDLALRHPQKVRSLILAATTCNGTKALSAPTDLLQEWTALVSLPPEQAVERGLPFLYSDEFIAKNKEDLTRRALRYTHLRPPLEALQRQFLAVTRFNAYDRLPEIRVPTLVLTGSEDKIMPPEESRLIAQRIPGAELVELAGAGHGYLIEKAEEANAVVLQFLRRHRRGSGEVK